MAKVKPKQLMPGMPVVDFAAPAELRVVKVAKEKVSNYTLDDKTVIHVKPVMLDVRRALKQYNPNGQPMYFLKVGFAITTTVPKSLIKGAKKIKRKNKRK